MKKNIKLLLGVLILGAIFAGLHIQKTEASNGLDIEEFIEEEKEAPTLESEGPEVEELDAEKLYQESLKPDIENLLEEEVTTEIPQETKSFIITYGTNQKEKNKNKIEITETAFNQSKHLQEIYKEFNDEIELFTADGKFIFDFWKMLTYLKLPNGEQFVDNITLQDIETVFDLSEKVAIVVLKDFDFKKIAILLNLAHFLEIQSATERLGQELFDRVTTERLEQYLENPQESPLALIPDDLLATFFKNINISKPLVVEGQELKDIFPLPEKDLFLCHLKSGELATWDYKTGISNKIRVDLAKLGFPVEDIERLEIKNLLYLYPLPVKGEVLIWTENNYLDKQGKSIGDSRPSMIVDFTKNEVTEVFDGFINPSFKTKNLFYSKYKKSRKGRVFKAIKSKLVKYPNNWRRLTATLEIWKINWIDTLKSEHPEYWWTKDSETKNAYTNSYQSLRSFYDGETLKPFEGENVRISIHRKYTPFRHEILITPLKQESWKIEAKPSLSSFIFPIRDLILLDTDSETLAANYKRRKVTKLTAKVQPILMIDDYTLAYFEKPEKMKTIPLVWLLNWPQELSLKHTLWVAALVQYKIKNGKAFGIRQSDLKILRSMPSDKAEALYNMGLIPISLKDFESAIEDFSGKENEKPVSKEETEDDKIIEID